MKQGTTTTFKVKQFDLPDITEIIFSFTNDKNNVVVERTTPTTDDGQIHKSYPSEVSLEDGYYKIGLDQDETLSLNETFYVEAQIMFSGAVTKAYIDKVKMPHTFYTKVIDGATTNGEEIELAMELSDVIEINGGGSSNYNDLTNKPRINNIELIGNKTTSDLGLDIEVGDGLKRSGNVVSVDIDDNSILEFDNHKLSADTSGLANALTVSIDSSTYVMSIDLWHNNTRLGGGTVDLPLESVVVSGSYDAQTKEVVLTLQSGSTVRFSVADLVSGLQAEITPQNKLDATLIQTNEYNNFVTLDEKQSWTDKQDKLTAGTNITIDSNNVISASGGSYTFTDGLTESSGTVGIDLASGSKLLIDANDKLDVDLSSKQDTIDSTHKLSADNVDDTNSTNKFVSANEKQTWNDKADNTTISTDTTSTTVSLTLADNHEYRYTQDLTSLTLTMPSGNFISSIVFASGSTPTSMTYDSSIKWSGDDVTNGQFVPSADKDYDICLYYNGLNVNGIVRGV